MKRDIRQRCGFGCVICGLPLYEYEHIEGWAHAQTHIANEITLLCDGHHREKTSGLLPKEAVQNADKNPRNLRVGQSRPINLHYYGGTCTISIGGNVFGPADIRTTSGISAITVDDEPLLAFSFQNGQLLLSLQVFDANDDRVLWIHENELAYSVCPWDITWIGQVLQIREGTRNLQFEIRFSPPNRVEVLRGYMRYHGYEFLVCPDRLYYLNQANVLRNFQCVSFDSALVVGAQVPRNTAIHYPGINRNFVQLSREQIVEVYRDRLGENVNLRNGLFVTGK